MKVAMVTPYWWPVRGGVTSYVSELSDELRRAYGADVHVIAREGGAKGARVLGGSPAQFVRRAARELEKISPDLVHAHGHWYALQAAIVYRTRKRRVRVVFTLHTELAPEGWIKRIALRRMLSRADFLTAVSEDLLVRTVLSLEPRTRTRVTRPGVASRHPERADVDRFLRSSGLAGRAPRVAFVGPLVYEHKSRGVAELIRAMKVVRRDRPGAVLVVAGDGEHRASLEALAAEEIPGGAVFLGDVEDPAPVFASADVYAHISFQEGLPLAVLEAMANGVPVVATPTGGIPEVIRDRENGILVAGGPNGLAQTVLEVLRSRSLAQRLAAAATADVSTRFSWSQSGAANYQLYGGETSHRAIVTVDLERDYHAPEGSYLGMEEALPRLLGMFERHGIVAEFFATSDLCARYPDRLREVVLRGHGLGCHGESHDVAYLSSKPGAWQLASIRSATEAIHDCTGQRPYGFRAPNFSANGATVRALEHLGYRYDASVLPGRVVRARGLFTKLDFLVAPRDPYRPARGDVGRPGGAGIVEFPVAENPAVAGNPIGLGYVHAAGAARALDAVGRCCGDPCVVLIHPWELVDPPPGRIPRWMRVACTTDSSGLEEFLSGLRQRHQITTFDRELEARPVAAPPSGQR